MDPRTGKKIRMGRLFGADGRALLIAYSHGVIRGPLPGLDRAGGLAPMIRRMRSADGVMVSPGMLPLVEEEFVGRDAPALVLMSDWMNQGRLHGGKRLYPEGVSTPMVTAEQAVSVGADAVMTYLWVGGSDPRQEAEEVRRNSEWARACEAVGLPLMIESRGLRDEYLPDGMADLELLKLHTRMAAELGADLIKTVYSGSPETFREVTSACHVPILVAGGSKRAEADAFKLAEETIAGGGAGIVFGRNIFQSADVEGTLARFRGIVHPGAAA
jgi:fructose-bisphosphate aldolase, class I